MPRYLIERQLEGAGRLTPEERHAISAKSNSVLDAMHAEGRHIQWDHSYVTENAINCVYVASDPAVIREHARRGSFPCTNISEIADIIDPVTGEPAVQV